MYCEYIHNIYGGIPDALLMLLQHLIELAARSHPRFIQLHTHTHTHTDSGMRSSVATKLNCFSRMKGNIV
jgi:hypothetical protein